MIPADNFQLVDDGHAWWVCVGDVQTIEGVSEILFDLDRPCDSFRPVCNRIGPGFGKPDHRGCPDCDGAGWHTFDIEVAHTYIGGVGGYWLPVTFRVHVIDVLPIVDNEAPEWFARNDHHIGIGRDEWAEYNGRLPGDHEPRWITDLTLPPDAAPGKWLVRLAVHTPENVETSNE